MRFGDPGGGEAQRGRDGHLPRQVVQRRAAPAVSRIGEAVISPLFVAGQVRANSTFADASCSHAPCGVSPILNETKDLAERSGKDLWGSP